MSEFAELVAEIAEFEHDPLGHAQTVYPWGVAGTMLEQEAGPRAWQADTLDTIGKHLRNPETRFTPLRIAIASGHGIGKSALISMVNNWGLDTCDDCRIVITANTEGQLRNKTWPEITKWRRLSITAPWWDIGATAIFSRDKAHEKSWRADAVPWSKENSEAFAGLHNKGKRIIVIMDEGSAIDDKIFEVTEGALTDENTEIIWLVFGNPTRAEGRFREAFRKFRHLWVTKQIDSRTVEGTNKAQLQEWVDTYGEDSDFVKIRVRGVFPNLSMKQYFSETDVQAAFGKHVDPSQYSFAPKILTCDPAWMGDDMLEIGLRQGLVFKVLASIPKNDNDLAVASKLAALEDEHGADAVFVDLGWGTGIVSAGQSWGRDWQLVNFADAAIDPGYANKRAEMYGEAKKWIKAGGAIPPSEELRADLLVLETVPRTDGRIQLEAKKDIKKRIGRSPGKADILALSFAYPVTHKARKGPAAPAQTGAEYDPYAGVNAPTQTNEYDPYAA